MFGASVLRVGIPEASGGLLGTFRRPSGSFGDFGGKGGQEPSLGLRGVRILGARAGMASWRRRRWEGRAREARRSPALPGRAETGRDRRGPPRTPRGDGAPSRTGPGPLGRGAGRARRPPAQLRRRRLRAPSAPTAPRRGARASPSDAAPMPATSSTPPSSSAATVAAARAPPPGASYSSSRALSEGGPERLKARGEVCSRSSLGLRLPHRPRKGGARAGAVPSPCAKRSTTPFWGSRATGIPGGRSWQSPVGRWAASGLA